MRFRAQHEISQAAPGIVQFRSLLKRTPLRNQAGFSRDRSRRWPAVPLDALLGLARLHAARSADARRVLVRNCLVRFAQLCTECGGDACNGDDLKIAWIFRARPIRSSRPTNMDDDDGEQIVEGLAG